jgi:hypothetical protein
MTFQRRRIAKPCGGNEGLAKTTDDRRSWRLTFR